MAHINWMEQNIIQSSQSALEELVKIWDYVGLNDDDRRSRYQDVGIECRKVLNQFIEKENKFCVEMEECIELRRRNIAELRHQLQLPPFLPERGLTLYDLLKTLDEQFKEMTEEKISRCTTYVRLHKRIENFASRLLKNHPQLVQIMDRYSSEKFPPIDDAYSQLTSENQSEDLKHKSILDAIKNPPTQLVLEKILKVHDELNSIYAPLVAKHGALCEDIARIAVDIDYQADTNDEVDLFRFMKLDQLCCNANLAGAQGLVLRASTIELQQQLDVASNPDLDSNEPVVNDAVLKQLTDLRLKLVKEKARLVGTCDELRSYLAVMWKRLDKPPSEQQEFLDAKSGYKPKVLEALQDEVDRCQQLKWENMQPYLKRLQTEIKNLAQICCLDKDQLFNLASNSPDSDPEVLINHFETLLDQLNHTYSQNRSIYNLIGQYELMWSQLTEVECKLKDPAIFSNRGGILLKTEKEKKRMLKEIDRLEKEIVQSIEQHDAESGEPFVLSNGKSFGQHVNERWATYRTSNRDISRSRKSILQPGPNARPNSGNLIGSSVSPV